jgi:hypothetical protein
MHYFQFGDFFSVCAYSHDLGTAISFTSVAECGKENAPGHNCDWDRRPVRQKLIEIYLDRLLGKTVESTLNTGLKAT